MLVVGGLTSVLQSYEHRDVAAALEVWNRDREIDALNNSLVRELLTYMMEDPSQHFILRSPTFCIKSVERIGDHATNIAETVYYIVKGHNLRREGPEEDVTTEE